MAQASEHASEAQAPLEQGPDPDPFATWLRSRRQARRLTQKILAAQSNIAPGSIRAIEQGIYRPGDGQAEALACQLRLSHEDPDTFIPLFVAVARRRLPVNELPPADPLQAGLLVTAETLSTPPQHPPPRPPCPYPGLRSFTREERDGFYGRMTESRALRDKLAATKCAFLIGPSGSGKTSLLQAGLAPLLPGSSAFGGRSWAMVDVRPREDPIQELRRQLELLATHPPPEATLPALALFYQELIGRSHNLLIIVDPLEELFTYASDQADAFLSTLREIATIEQCYVVAAIRADFYHRLMTPQHLPWVQAGRVEITRLSALQLEEAIVQPARNAGVLIEPALVERLKSDVGDEPGVLPLLQVTLERLWDEVSEQRLTRDAYINLAPGEISPLYRVLANQAEATLIKLGEHKRALAWRIFLRLVQFGEGRADTRRQQRVDELVDASGESDAVEQTLQHLGQGRLLILGKDSADQKVVDVAHEALLTHWVDLARVLSRYREAELKRRRLEGLAAIWEQRGKEGGGLSEIELADTEPWLVSDEARVVGASQMLHNFVAQSAAAVASHRHDLEYVQHQLQAQSGALKRSRRLLATAVGGVLLIALVLLGQFVGHEVARRQADAAAEMVSITAGPAVIGFATGIDQIVVLPAFRIDKYEVRNRDYRACVDAGVCEAPQRKIGQERFRDPQYDNFPIVDITPTQAEIFCRWRGRRLPTVTEWERAVRGSTGRMAPWNEKEPTPGSVQLWTRPFEPNSPTEVDALPASTTPLNEGAVFHLYGNVEEIVHSGEGSKEQTPYLVVGGSYRDSLINDFREPIPLQAEFGQEFMGFRCAAE